MDMSNWDKISEAIPSHLSLQLPLTSHLWLSVNLIFHFLQVSINHLFRLLSTSRVLRWFSSNIFAAPLNEDRNSRFLCKSNTRFNITFQLILKELYSDVHSLKLHFIDLNEVWIGICTIFSKFKEDKFTNDFQELLNSFGKIALQLLLLILLGFLRLSAWRCSITRSAGSIWRGGLRDVSVMKVLEEVGGSKNHALDLVRALDVHWNGAVSSGFGDFLEHSKSYLKGILGLEFCGECGDNRSTGVTAIGSSWGTEKLVLWNK